MRARRRAATETPERPQRSGGAGSCRLVAKAPLAAPSHLDRRGVVRLANPEHRGCRPPPSWKDAARDDESPVVRDVLVAGGERRRPSTTLVIACHRSRAGCPEPDRRQTVWREQAAAGRRQTRCQCWPGRRPCGSDFGKMFASRRSSAAQQTTRVRLRCDRRHGLRGRDRNPSGPRRRSSRRLGRAADVVAISAPKSNTAR